MQRSSEWGSAVRIADSLRYFFALLPMQTRAKCDDRNFSNLLQPGECESAVANLGNILLLKGAAVGIGGDGGLARRLVCRNRERSRSVSMVGVTVKSLLQSKLTVQQPRRSNL